MRFSFLVLFGFGIIGLGIIVADAGQSYYYYRNFPDAQKAYVAHLIRDGHKQHCDGLSIDGKDVKQSLQLIDACFSRAISSGVYIDATPERDYDSIRLTYQCSTKDISARFQFVQGRSDSIIWCEYRLGKTLAEVPVYTDQDFAYVPQDPPFLVKLLARLFG